MSEDEKKAIELTNNFIEYFNKNIQDGNRADLTVLGEEIEAIKIILNLIENQQKEISELKEEINYWKECAEGEAGLRKQIQEDYQQQMQELLESEK